jgi:tetratricopeptide (TPR) repeat protein
MFGFWVLGMVLTPPVVRSQSISLQSGLSIERQMTSTESHSFDVTLQRDQLIELTLSAQDLKLRLRMLTADGNTLAEMVHRRSGPSTWSFIAPQSSVYQLVVSSLEHGTTNGKYQLHIGQIKAATDRERKDLTAAADFYRAEVLRLKSENGELTRALESYQAAAIAWEQQRQWTKAADAWQQIGDVHFSRANYKEALRAFDRSLKLTRRAGSSAQIILQEANIGYVHIYLGNLDEAWQIFDRCKEKLHGITAAESVTRQRLEAQLLNNYGEVANGRGNLKISLDFFGRALAQWTTMGDRQGMALAHLNSGYSYLDSGSVREAAAEFTQALKLWREIGDWRGEALTLTAQGNL